MTVPFLSCLIVGCGYVGTRLARLEAARRPVLALVRSGPRATELEAGGIRHHARGPRPRPDPALQPSLAAAAKGAAIVYLVPPPESRRRRIHGSSRSCANWATRCPAVFVYISTTGVYGDTAGAWSTSRAPVAPGNDRAQRRVAAESAAILVLGAGRSLRHPAGSGDLRPAPLAARAAAARRTSAAAGGRRTRQSHPRGRSRRRNRRRRWTSRGPGRIQRDRRRPCEHDAVPAARWRLPRGCPPATGHERRGSSAASRRACSHSCSNRAAWSNRRMLDELGVQMRYPNTAIGRPGEPRRDAHGGGEGE